MESITETKHKSKISEPSAVPLSIATLHFGKHQLSFLEVPAIVCLQEYNSTKHQLTQTGFIIAGIVADRLLYIQNKVVTSSQLLLNLHYLPF